MNDDPNAELKEWRDELRRRCLPLHGGEPESDSAELERVERRGGGMIGMHPTCHLELHEERGYDRLHGLSARLVGETQRAMTSSDVAAVSEPMAALIVELPTRENGGRLAPWDDLVELCRSTRERGIAVHLDGARSGNGEAVATSTT
ncbi:MAG: beta-eliminating lyase-related protein [Acidimicrobiia bacterium]|nr:beta-eliminating lyase-related protein [Acidimicrobiia bacterium]